MRSQTLLHPARFPAFKRKVGNSLNRLNRQIDFTKQALKEAGIEGNQIRMIDSTGDEECVNEEEALQNGMEAKSKESVEQGAEVYARA
jgi:hypothetical protein